MSDAAEPEPALIFKKGFGGVEDMDSGTFKTSNQVLGNEFLRTVKYRLLTEDQVHQWIGLSVATLRTMRSRPGRDPIPFTKVGKGIRYREDLLLKWLERNTFDSIG